MALTSTRLVIRSSKLYPMSTPSFSLTQNIPKNTCRGLAVASRRDPLSFSGYALPHRRCFSTRQCYASPKYVSICTIPPASLLSDSRTKFPPIRALQHFSISQVSAFALNQRRYVSTHDSVSEQKIGYVKMCHILPMNHQIFSHNHIHSSRPKPSSLTRSYAFLAGLTDTISNTNSPLQTPRIDAPQILQKALNPTPHENIYTIPNILTFSRLLSAPAIGYFILNSQPVTALALFAYAGFTDLIDGYLARRFNSQTVVGTILDPMADKTLMTVAVVCLGIQGLIPVWLAVIVLGRDVGLAISACYYRYISLPPPKTFTRYWDFSLPSAEVRPTEISKINTLLQLLLVGNAMILPVLPSVWVEAWNLAGVFEGWQYLVASTTIWSGLSYVFSKDAVKILSREESAEKEKGEEIEQGERR